MNIRPESQSDEFAPPKFKVLCDFDGTAAAADVGNALFLRFAGHACYDIIQLWKDGQISSKECLRRECEITRVTRSELDDYCRDFAMTAYFKQYLAWCNDHEIPLDIVSDGLDFYVGTILANHHLLERVRLFTNELTFIDADRIEASFPYYSAGCGQCANCKGYHVRQAQKEGSKVIYIGDGLSDRCGARAADYVFARRGRDLERFCDQHDIVHTKFDSFDTVLEETKQIVAGNKV